MKKYVKTELIYNIMCSIIGYFGHDDAAPTLVRGLKRMEYRGYDSVGVLTGSDNKFTLKKGVGRVSEVNNKLGLDLLHGSTGIGHTRWATHGKVTDKNAHPHLSNSGKIAIVHNGIIENFEELKSNLQNKGFDFQSETDTEIIANLIQLNFDETSDIKQSIIKTVAQLKGHYSFVVIFEDGTLVAARFHEPLIVGVEKDNYYLSSDVLGFIEKTDDAIYIDNEDFVIVNNAGMHIFDFDGTPVKYQITKVSKEFANVKGYQIGGKTGTADQPAKGGYSKKKVNTFVSIFPTSNPKFVLIVMLDKPKANKEFVYYYRDGRNPYKGNWRNTAGWTTVWITGQIIEKIGPILATKY